jgi:versiconal hemiacetal acetate esterase
VTLSPNLSSYPPVYIATCEKDILRDDGIVLEHMLQDAGTKVKRDHYGSFPHYFFIFPSVKTSLTFILNAVQGIKFVLNLE